MVAPLPVSPLLEREPERALLERAWQRARSGRGSAWFICAEAGGGKTRLLQEIATFGTTLWGAAEPVSPPDPFQPIAQALPGFVPAATRADSVAGALAVLEQAAGTGPLILVLDDLHFADEGSVAVFVRISRLCDSRPWLVLAGARPGEGPPALTLALAELVAQGVAQRLDLAPLSRAAVGTLLAELRGGAGTETEVDTVYHDSGGNPWFAQALARGVGAMSATRDRILVRLERLEEALPGAAALLAALAPAGEPLSHALVSRRFGGDGADLRRLLRGLRDYGVLQETTAGAWQFRHELLRRALLDEMLEADRRDAHRALAEALEQTDGGAAAIAMHYAAAGDGRTGPWALRAAQAARAVNAHVEAMAQLERALAFDLPPETRRSTLTLAADVARVLGRFGDGRRLAAEAIALPGGQPEEVAYLHFTASAAAGTMGDTATSEAHLAAAERLLQGRPPSYIAAHIILARAHRWSRNLEPERALAAVPRAMAMTEACTPDRAAILEFEANRIMVRIVLQGGDPAGFDQLERLLAAAEQHGLWTVFPIATLTDSYQGAILSLFHERAIALYERVTERVHRHEYLGWPAMVQPYRALELVQRGAYEAARALVASVTDAESNALVAVVLACVEALREMRAGSIEAARRAVDGAPSPPTTRDAALLDLARLELAMLTADPALAALSRRVYETGEAGRHARLAGVAAVALARACREAPPVPNWLVADAPPRVFWDWAAGIAHPNPAQLRDVSARFAAMACPYEAALALGDAGDLGESYRRLRDLGATTAREQVAARLRAAGQPVPRRSRDAIERDRLTDMEVAVCRLVAEGQSNKGIALRLSVSIRTVEAHLTHLYQKTGFRGRAALARWWTQREADATNAIPVSSIRVQIDL